MSTMKPILFNTDMVRAILAGRKTVTRRVVKPQPHAVIQPDGTPLWCGHFVSVDGKVLVDKPPYRPGDILYVPQAWKCVGIFGELGYEVEFQDGQRVKFKFESRERAKKWAKYRDKPSNHWQSPYFMPREAARIFLRVTDVRVERLQDITEEQARKEGAKPLVCWNCGGIGCLDCANSGCAEPALVEFRDIWNNTLKSVDRPLYGWDATPWVWVIEFERISREEAAQEEP